MTVIHGDREDLIWLAGLLEGEGTFDLHRGRYPRIRLGMTDRDIVGRAATLMDSKIRLALHPAPMKPSWHAEISGERAAAIMRELLPFMGARRSQKIAEILGAVRFGGDAPRSASAPGPAITRPAGITKPSTAA